ncbi:MAG: hypothetical protein QM642_03640 [Edaphocola sp.]
MAKQTGKVSTATVRAATNTEAKSSNSTKGIIALVLAVFLFFVVKHFNEDFLSGRIVQYWEDYKTQREDLEPETRLTMRHGASYVYSKNIAEVVKKAGAGPKDIALVPTTEFFASKGIDYPVPEPSVFYYFTGMRTYRPGNTMKELPKWYVYFEGQRVFIEKIDSKAKLDSILTVQKPYFVKN